MAEKINDRGVEAKSTKLAGKRLAVGVCGSIGAVEVVKIIRELRRHGASVSGFLTPSVASFITEASIEWALAGKVIGSLSPDLDHLDPYDGVIIVPATWNTIAKCAVGIADNPVTLLVASQLGRGGQILFVPAMNQLLKAHPLFGAHRSALEKMGASWFEASEEEGRLKIPAAEQLAGFVVEWLTK